MDIESAATSAIKSRIANTDLLSQFINERDKEPVWDGAIYAYKNSNKKNENLIGRAPVQVKGKIGKCSKKKTITYPIQVNNLKHYRKDGGVLYFVVCINEEHDKKIFYALLLPFLLNQYICMANGRKTISVRLKALPEKDTDFENIVINFINDRFRQMQMNNGKNWSINEVAELLGANNFKMNCQFTCIGYDRNNPFEYLKDNELYLYAQNKDGSLSFPVNHIEHVESMFHDEKMEVFAKGTKYYEKVRIENRRDGSTIVHIGKVFEFVILKGKSKFHYVIKGTLKEQIKSIHFLLDVINDKGLYLNKTKLHIEPTSRELAKLKIADQENRLKYLDMIVLLCNKLGIKRDLDLDSLTHKQEEYLRMLINAILYDKCVRFKEKQVIPPVVVLDIANLKIILLFREKEDGSYEVKDFIRTNIECKIDREGNFPTTQFSILNADDFLSVDNLDWKIIEDGFKSFDNQGHYERMVLSSLELLKAYDKNHEKIQCLVMAKNFCEWLLNKDPNNVIYKVNLLQCIKRSRMLNDTEYEQIEECLQKKGIDKMLKVALNILMGNKDNANRIINTLSNEDKRILENYPIYQLYKEL